MIDLLFINMCSVPGVHPRTTEAIIKQESAFEEAALNINSKGFSFASLGKLSPKTRPDAIALAKELLASKVNFDAGLMQINSSNFKAYGLKAEDAFDPCKNIRVGSAILKRFYDRAEVWVGPGQKALQAALSAYNTGNARGGFANGYVAKFYGKKAAYAADPYRAGMAESSADSSDKDGKIITPYNVSMVPPAEGENQSVEGVGDD